MKRALVLTNESARHPFRRSLPPPRDRRRRPVVPVSAAVTLAGVALLASFSGLAG